MSGSQAKAAAAAAIATEQSATTTASTTQPVVSTSVPAPTTHPAKVLSLEVFLLLSKVHAQNGLRHDDFTRYRVYCRKRIHKLRQSLGICQTSRGKYVKKTFSVEQVTKPRHLEAVLMYSERCWAYWMALKNLQSPPLPRVHFHMLRKLRKATKWSTILDSLCTALGDPKTFLEAKIYHSWMLGNFAFENQEWLQAYDNYVISRTILDRLHTSAPPDQGALYKDRLEELEPKIRFSVYNLKKQNPEVILNEAYDQEIISTSIPNLQEKIQSLSQQQNASLQEFKLKGKTIVIKNEKVKRLLQKAFQQRKNMEKLPSFEKKLAAHSAIALCYTHALEVTAQILSRQKSRGTRKTGSSTTPDESIQELVLYLQIEKSRAKLEKTLDQAHTLQSCIGEGGFPDIIKQQSVSNKVSPGVLVRLCDAIIQEMEKLQQTAQENNSALIESYRAHRCYFLAVKFAQERKWVEAISLLKLAAQRASTAFGLLKAVPEPIQADLERSVALQKQIESHTRVVAEKAAAYAAKRAQSTQNSAATIPSTDTQAHTSTSVTVTATKSTPSPAAPAQPQPTATATNANITTATTAEAAPVEAQMCKPLLFDLTFATIDYPSLEARKKAPTPAPAPARSGGLFSFWRS
ncbi:signal recognition particle 68 kDa protein [Pelomyxa schiedti]|nr:signal recognition particle 68 kDa protein [Pelomyxa schiedti]